MTKNPFVNALLAVAYISLMATFLYYGSRMTEGNPDTVIMPITMLSLLVLSVAMMGIIFFYQPIRMYLDGDKTGSVSLLVKTVTVFACTTIIFAVGMVLIA